MFYRGFRGAPILDFYNDTTPFPGANGTYSTDYYRDRALEVIDEHSKSKEPMFMFLSFQAPHTPNQVRICLKLVCCSFCRYKMSPHSANC